MLCKSKVTEIGFVKKMISNGGILLKFILIIFFIWKYDKNNF